MKSIGNDQYACRNRGNDFVNRNKCTLKMDENNLGFSYLENNTVSLIKENPFLTFSGPFGQ